MFNLQGVRSFGATTSLTFATLHPETSLEWRHGANSIYLFARPILTGSRYGQSSHLHPRAGGERYGSDRYSSSSAPAYPASSPGFAAYPAATSYRSATPNRKGQYSASVLEELESQNDEQVAGLSAKVRMLRDVRPPLVQ